jgi:hypothetical protein
MAGDPPLAVTAVSASANDGNIPGNTLDGSLFTRWSANGDGQWILFDLGANQTVGSVTIAWHKGDLRVARFEIRTSQNGATWTTVFSGLSSGSTAGFESYDVPDSTARFVVIVGHGNTRDLWNSISEVGLYASSSGSGIPPAATEVLLPVASVIASSHDGNVPANTLDRNLSTRWSANGDGQWILYDLGANRTIRSIDIAWHQGNTRAAHFEVHTSLDGAGWTTVFNGTSSGTTLNAETFNLTDSNGRYVSIEGHGNSYNSWNSISEVGIYGFAASGTNLPPAQPPTTNAPPALLPSKLLNLTNWKLTLPVDTSRPGSPDEIRQPELATFQDANYFHLTGKGNGVVFKAHCGGATTSGSGYPRSELREMVNNGMANASWSTTNGTHTMEIRQAVTHLPDVKPHVVVGQIHDAGDDVIVFRLEGWTLFVDENGSRGPVLTTNYQLGTEFTVKFVARNGGVECYYNGRYIYTYWVNTSGCYFKAGCYTQSNTSRGGSASAYGEVVIYDVKVSHQ